MAKVKVMVRVRARARVARFWVRVKKP